MRSKLKGVRRKAFVSGLPIVRVERCLQDALDNLETAVHKMTGLPAARFGLPGRGLIEVGCAADLVVFKPDQIRDNATFSDPMRPASGIHQVYVNGQLSWQDGAGTGQRAGQVIRRAAMGSTP